MAKELSNTEQVCATLLFYFAAGMDAKTVIDSGGKADIDVPSPSEGDLNKIFQTTPVAVWQNAMEVASAIVANIVENEPRDVMTVFKEAFTAGKKIKETAQAVLGPRNADHLASAHRKGGK